MGLTTAITDALGHGQRFEYDDRNNLSKMTDAEGNFTLFSYDQQNKLISTTNQLGQVTTYTYDLIFARTEAVSIRN
jgi:YD repeat-containing protein